MIDLFYNQNLVIDLFCFVLIVIAVVDLKKYIIPNFLVFALMLITGYKFILFDDEIGYYLISGLITAGLMLFLYYLGKKELQKEPIGFGDIKLLTVIALYHGIFLTLAGIWVASLLALTVYMILKLSGKQFSQSNKIPFGFFIGLTFVFLTIYEFDIKVFLLGIFA